MSNGAVHPLPPLVPIQQAAGAAEGVPLEAPPPKTGKGSRVAKTKADNEAKDLVRKKLDETKEYGLRIVDEDKGDLQSPAWKKFAQVIDLSTQQDVPFVRCRQNCKVIKMKTKGRGNLANHSCPKNPDTPRVIADPPSKDDLKQFRGLLVQLLVGKLLPIRLIDSDELTAVVQAALTIGAKCGPTNVDQIMPCSRTTTADIKTLADKARAVLVGHLTEDVEDGLTSSTVDCWTENYHKRKILCSTLSHISENFELSEYTLFTTHCDAESVDGDLIRAEIESNMELLQLGTGSTVHFVSDDGADIVKALNGKSRTYCMDHGLNLCVRKALQPQLTKIDLYGKKGGAVLDAVGRAVDEIKSSRKRSADISALKCSLKTGPHDVRGTQTIFKSCVPMLESAMQNFKEVKDALGIIGKCDILHTITQEDISAVVSIVKPLETLAKSNTHCSNTFKASHYESVVELTNATETDCNLTKQMKAHIKLTVLPILYILSVIKKCKDIVSYMKSSGLNDSLKEGNLVQEVDTRWMSNLLLLRSFFIWPKSKPETEEDGEESVLGPAEERQPSQEKIQQINEILQEKGKTQLRLTDDDVDLMIQLINILKKFETAVKKFEASKKVTIQHVIPQYRKLRKFLSPKEDDSVVLAAFRAELLSQLEKKVPSNISMRHKLGMFFWPKFADLPGFTEKERADVLDHARKLCKTQEECLKRRGKLRDSEGTAEPAAKRRRRRQRSESSDEEYDSLLTPAQIEQAARDEVEKYISLADVNVLSGDILSWWKARAAMFPILSRVVRMILATPASSASSERVFSASGQIITPKRSNMMPETLNDLLFLNSFLKKFDMSVLTSS